MNCLFLCHSVRKPGSVIGSKDPQTTIYLDLLLWASSSRFSEHIGQMYSATQALTLFSAKKQRREVIPLFFHIASLGS